jgi:hypothetical protein
LATRFAGLGWLIGRRIAWQKSANSTVLDSVVRLEKQSSGR